MQFKQSEHCLHKCDKWRCCHMVVCCSMVSVSIAQLKETADHNLFASHHSIVFTFRNNSSSTKRSNRSGRPAKTWLDRTVTEEIKKNKEWNRIVWQMRNRKLPIFLFHNYLFLICLIVALNNLINETQYSFSNCSNF